MALIRSSLLGVPHGFPDREGGVSTGPFASLNASVTVGDEPAAVAENLARLASALGTVPESLRAVHQVHGVTVLEATGVDAPAPLEPLGTADALVTRSEGLAVGVKTADCLPVLIEDPVGRQVAAVHAGWRGVLGDIAGAAVERLCANGARARELRVAIGPAIQACCFEVDGDLPERFRAAFGESVIRRVHGKARVHLDLARAVSLSLGRRGVPAAHVDVLAHCTQCEARFFSYRRDAGRTGRHLSLIRCMF